MHSSVCLYFVLLLSIKTVLCNDLHTCSKREYWAKAEQVDENGLRCWDVVKVHSCGGRCDSREISDWEFPFKKSFHPVCAYGNRKPTMVYLRHCDPGVATGTDRFNFITADDCKCKVCSSENTSCEWLPTNSTLLELSSEDELLTQMHHLF